MTQAPPEMGGSSSEVFPVFAFRALHSTHMASREVFAFWLSSSSMNFTAQQLAVWPNIGKAPFVAQPCPIFPPNATLLGFLSLFVHSWAVVSFSRA